MCSALCGWWDQWQPTTVRAEKHYHHISFLWWERHLSTGWVHQLSWAALHQHQHSDEHGQHVPPQQGSLPTRTQGRYHCSVMVHALTVPSAAPFTCCLFPNYLLFVFKSSACSLLHHRRWSLCWVSLCPLVLLVLAPVQPHLVVCCASCFSFKKKKHL